MAWQYLMGLSCNFSYVTDCPVQMENQQLTVAVYLPCLSSHSQLVVKLSNWQQTRYILLFSQSNNSKFHVACLMCSSLLFKIFKFDSTLLRLKVVSTLICLLKLTLQQLLLPPSNPSVLDPLIFLGARRVLCSFWSFFSRKKWHKQLVPLVFQMVKRAKGGILGASCTCEQNNI